MDRADTDDVGLVVTATHGRGGVRRMMLESVADKLVRGAETPVLVIRSPATAAWRIPEEQTAVLASF